MNIDSLDYQHIQATLNQVPQRFHSVLHAEYQKKYQKESCRDANLYFLDVQDKVQDKSVVTVSDEGLRVKAKRLSRDAARIIQQSGFYAGLSFCEFNGVDEPKAQHEAGAIARLTDEAWWIRQLIKKQDRETEAFAIQLGLVRRYRQVYISDEMLSRIGQRQKRSVEIMENLEAVSDEGETVNMLDVLKGSLANPAVRRAELMIRLNGFEQYAKEKGHVAEFYTITAPSKYHAVSDKYAGSTPKQTQQYFTNVWSRIRAKLDREGITPYGFRIAEPHHDGTPHWHMLLFVADQDKVKLRAIIKHYALQEDGKEAGAAKRRFTVEAINPNKGSAVGYIAKYISKNIDAFGMEHEEDYEAGSSAETTASRVRAWASTWGIRQFQQIGGSPVGVWRELRRLEDAPEGVLNDARQAADASDWKRYLEIQGGADVPFRDQPIKTLRREHIDTETGEVKQNQYGELVDHVVGVYLDNEELITRLKHWQIRKVIPETDTETVPIAPAGENAATPEFSPSWSTVNNCTQDTESDHWKVVEREYQRHELTQRYTEMSKGGKNSEWETIKLKKGFRFTREGNFNREFVPDFRIPSLNEFVNQSMESLR
jgi:hypothetical protein